MNEPDNLEKFQAGLNAVAGETTAQRLLREAEFTDPKLTGRRLASELMGTFFLTLVAAGAPMVAAEYPGTVTMAAAVVAPALMVTAIILFMGKVSGAHLNPGVTIAFSLRRDFPWRHVPGYILAQLLGAILAALLLQNVLTSQSAMIGGSQPGAHTAALTAMIVEALLTFGLVSTILGTASGAQNIGIIGALGVGSYIALAGLWAAPLSGASMNFARSFGPAVASGDYTNLWVYLAGPLLGAVGAVGAAWVLRGPGGGRDGSQAAQGALAEISNPHKQ